MISIVSFGIGPPSGVAQRRKGSQPSNTGKTPGPGRAMKGPSKKMKWNVSARARWMRIDWMLKIAALVPPPCRQSMVGRVELGPWNPSW